MRSKTILMLLFCGAVFASIGYFMLTGKSPKQAWEWAENGFKAPRVRLEPEVTPPTVAIAKKAFTAPRPQRVVFELPVQPEVEVAAEPLPPPPPPKPQPVSSDRIIGISKAELLERYSTPSLQLNSVQDGDVLESVYYTRKGSSKPTVVELRNGVVTIAQFGASPAVTAK